MLGQIGDQTAVSLHSFDHRLPGPAAIFPAVKEDDGGRPDRTGFSHKQIHEKRSYVLVTNAPDGLTDATAAFFRHFSTGRQVAKCTCCTCAATRKALAATVKLGFRPVLEGKNEVSTT